MQFREYLMVCEKNLLCLTTEFTPKPITHSLQRLHKETIKRKKRQQGNVIIIFPLMHASRDVTVCLPLDQPVNELEDGFSFISRLHSDNAMKTRHEGNLLDLDRSMGQIVGYLQRKNLKPPQHVYCKILNGLGQETGFLKPDMENTIVDIYITL